jgi:hypothetical protein
MREEMNDGGAWEKARLSPVLGCNSNNPKARAWYEQQKKRIEGMKFKGGGTAETAAESGTPSFEPDDPQPPMN